MAVKPKETRYYDGCEHPWQAADRAGRGIMSAAVGRPPKYETPEALAAVVADYFNWNETNPIRVAEVKSFKDDSWDHLRAQRRPKTIVALCVFIGIDEATWRGWRNPENPKYRPEFSTIIARAEDLIRQDKIEGAASGQYNATIISRLLGLTEKVETTGTLTVKMERDDSDL